jgi:hypothetical protein
MGRGGRFGKYGEHKRFERLRRKRRGALSLKPLKNFLKENIPRPEGFQKSFIDCSTGYSIFGIDEIR